MLFLVENKMHVVYTFLYYTILRKDEKMDYENFYEEMQQQEKRTKELLAGLQKLFKTISRETENGDVKGLAKDVSSMNEAADTLTEVLRELKDTVSGFDARAYFENGDFAAQMLEACRDKEVDVRGDFPVYEMFPYRVRLDAENQEVYLDRKKIACVRPQKVVETIRSGQEKLNRAPFNASVFINELADAYDLVLLKMKKRPQSDIYLTSLYKVLAPMGRFRRDYDQQSFAFDLARLYRSDIEDTKDGRRYQFGPSRNGGKAIRILNREGKEEYMATIRFYQPEKDSRPDAQ